ncbi:MAG: 23S rRNA (guanosine(2251)-2'-O)-methyltransferase RlmB [Pseudomonadota bacterium]
MTEPHKSGRKPTWVIDKEKASKAPFWIFGLHAVEEALKNAARVKLRLVVTRNAAAKLEEAIAMGGLAPEIADPRKFPVPLDPNSVHQGAAVEVRPLDWGALPDYLIAQRPLLCLDRVSDPHNVGAILRSAEVFGAAAVIAPARHSAPETGALAKTASGALERQPYLRVPNLGNALVEMKKAGRTVIGLDGTGTKTLDDIPAGGPLSLVLGAEGPGLRERTREICDHLARIPFSGSFGSLNVSNAAAVALYAVGRRP